MYSAEAADRRDVSAVDSKRQQSLELPHDHKGKNRSARCQLDSWVKLSAIGTSWHGGSASCSEDLLDGCRPDASFNKNQAL
mmetsp:Transcript_63841/g.146963  ORF Transcript_63841/g.146963 Transcript_63841/m.146963 type:complete len:81 (+) Transcript_63841:132-374(+)